MLQESAVIQRHLHRAAKLSGVCPESCASWALEVPLPTRPLVSGSCRTSVESGECYKKVQWAMQTGVVKYPERAGFFLSSDQMLQILGFPRAPARRSYVLQCVIRALCAMGIGGSFAHTGAGIGIAARLSKAGMLQESAVVEECYKKGQWAMQTGVVKYPECLTPLTNSSSSRIPAAPARRS